MSRLLRLEVHPIGTALTFKGWNPKPYKGCMLLDNPYYSDCYQVRNKGSWMEIGNSISHFGIMSAQVVFVLLLFALTNIYTKDIHISLRHPSSQKAM